MNQTQAKADHIAEILEGYFPETPIPLQHSSPYTLLVAVLLSAQCTDERVNKVTPALFQLADNPFDMEKQSAERIAEIIRPCGLSPKKSRAIQALSQILVAEYAGKVPKTFEQLEQLPGVGHKTASVVMSQAWGIPAFAVDTHIHRLATRWGLTSGKSVVETEKDLKLLFDRNIWNKIHLQIIFFGRKFCPARAHVPAECPICSLYGI